MENQLTTRPIGPLIKSIAIPASVGYFFNTMYNVVDTYFGGLVSTEALAALSLSLPVFFIIISLGTGISTGTTALIGTAIGAGRQEEAELIAAQGLSFGLITGLFLSFFGILASPFLFSILGAQGKYLEIATAYMNVIFGGAVFFMLIHMLNSILNALGDTRSYRNFLILGFLLNVGLDPWFIYGGFGLPPLGFAGIAAATVLVQIAGCVYLGYKVKQTKMVKQNLRAGLWPDKRVYLEIARQGFPASINMATIGIGMFIITWFISGFGKEGVAAYGAAMRVEQIVLMPTIGLNIATLTIVAQNNGAGFFDRIEETVKTALKFGGWLMLAGTIAVFAGARALMTVFSADPQVIDIGTTYLKIDALVLYAYVILFVNVASLQGIKRPMYAIWIGLYRQVAAPFIIFHLLAHTLGLGLVGVWWGILLITWSAALFTLFYARRLRKQIALAEAVGLE